MGCFVMRRWWQTEPRPWMVPPDDVLEREIDYAMFEETMCAFFRLPDLLTRDEIRRIFFDLPEKPN